MSLIDLGKRSKDLLDTSVSVNSGINGLSSIDIFLFLTK